MSELPEFLAPVDDLDAGDALADWRWLVGDAARPKLLTAMGDFVLVKPRGILRREAVFLLDTNAGTVEQIAGSWDEFRTVFASGEIPEHWFKAELVHELVQRAALARNQCYGAVFDLALGGTWDAANFKPVSWRVHVATTGQIHRQVSKLPPGTRIEGIDVVKK